MKKPERKTRTSITKDEVRDSEINSISVINSPSLASSPNFNHSEHFSNTPLEIMNTFKFESNKNFEFHLKTVKVDPISAQVSFFPTERATEKVEKLFDSSKISKADYDYYFSVVDKIVVDNSSGALFENSLIDERALKILTECNYNITDALNKILFPTRNILKSQSNLKDRKFAELFVHSACNELVGSNSTDRQKWIDHVTNLISQRIRLGDLKSLISIGEAMQIPIPVFILEEINKGFEFAREIKQTLSTKKHVGELTDLYEKSTSYKVIFEEFKQLEEVIAKAKKWELRVEELADKSVWFKTLQSIYNEAKSLPVILDAFKSIEERYFNALEWLRTYDLIEKNQKTRVNSGNLIKCTFPLLEEMIKEAENINFASVEVNTLINSYTQLKQSEERILLELEDPFIEKTPEKIKDYRHTLETIMFSSSLSDFIVEIDNYYDWEEDLKVTLRYKNMKMARLVRLADIARKLTRFEKTKEFVTCVDEMSKWCDQMNNILFGEGDETEVSYERLLQMMEIEFAYNCDEFIFFKEKGLELIEMMRELEKESLNFFDYLTLDNKIAEIVNNFDIKGSVVDKLKTKIKEAESLRDELLKIINCEEEASFFRQLKTIEDRDFNLRIIKLRKENILQLNLPQFVLEERDDEQIKRVKSFSNQSKLVESSFDFKNSDIDDIIAICQTKYYRLFSDSFFDTLIDRYNFLCIEALLNSAELTLEDAEKLLSERKMSDAQIAEIASKIDDCKAWKRALRKLKYGTDIIDVKEIEAVIETGNELPLIVSDLDMIKSIYNQYKTDSSLISEAFSSGRKLTLHEFNKMKKVTEVNMFNDPCFKFVSALAKIIEAWKNQTVKAINARMLAELFFKDPGETEETNLLNKKRATDKKKFDNIISIINNNKPHFVSVENEKEVENYNLERIKPNFFKTLSYEKKLEIVSKVTELREPKGVEFCICRRGDDSVNYMIQCDCCGIWFHGNCIGIKQNSSKKVEQFYCIVCNRRRYKAAALEKIEVLRENKRISLSQLEELIDHGRKLPVELIELEMLENELSKFKDWESRFLSFFEEVMHVLEHCKLNDFSEDISFENKAVSLFLESEGLFINVEIADNLIFLLNHIDWFREATKHLETKKKERRKPKHILAQFNYLFSETKLMPKVIKGVTERYFEIVSKIASEIEKEIVRETTSKHADEINITIPN